MLYLLEVRFSNLNTFGNEVHSIRLDAEPTTLLVGKNGSGKSSALLDSICLCLYNRPYRDLPKTGLINTWNNRGCLTEVDLVSNGAKITVRRGMKPNVFEIWRDGSLINQEDARAYQEYLENEILGMNFKTFTQIAILGTAQFVPFMQLKADKRRLFIEDILDQEIFTDMNKVLKARVAGMKVKIADNDKRLTVATRVLELEEKKFFDEQQNNTERLDRVNETLQMLMGALAILKQKQNANLAYREQMYSVNKPELLKKKLKQLEGYRTAMDSRLDDYIAEEAFYENNCECGTCRQQISDVHKQDRLTEIYQRKFELKKGLEQAEEKIAKILEDLEYFDKLDKEIRDSEDQWQILEDEAKQLKNKIVLYNEEVARLVTPVRGSGQDLTAAQDALVAISAEKDQLMAEATIMAHGAQLLKDDGVKAQIIKTYIPKFNELINKYLEKLDLNILFELDENFEESIKSRHRDTFRYNNFSEGEKLRIDLAILFAWREIASARNNASVNILVFDEILDASMDADGAADFVKLIKNMTLDVKTFVISHLNGETYSEWFDRTLRAVKKLNFSRIEQVA